MYYRKCYWMLFVTYCIALYTFMEVINPEPQSYIPYKALLPTRCIDYKYASTQICIRADHAL